MIEYDLFLSLIRLGIGQSDSETDTFAGCIDWNALFNLALAQGLLAICVDGIAKLPFGMRPKRPDLQQWIGEALQNEAEYSIQQKSAAQMALIFHDNGIRTYVLKGFVVSECYPNPQHRLSADLDSFLVPHNGSFNAWELGNQLMEQAGFDVDRSFYKNSTLYLPGLIVENHHFMTAIRGSKRLKQFERILQGLIYNDRGKDLIDGTYLYRPPVTATALFLIEHAYAHFVHEGLTWRHILDWMMFSRKHHNEIVWAEFELLIDKFGMRHFYESFVRLGRYLLGDFIVENLTKVDKMMLSDVWADLDLHETTRGFRGKVNLLSNTLRAGWKYKYFSDQSMLFDLFQRVTGFLFERHPKI